ncbi:nadp-dependent alcohol dehydrogenase [Moniliophthora roreri]|nr:nadp-dependent alcohol dehydrogenase [Moniliophthora roreri]
MSRGGMDRLRGFGDASPAFLIAGHPHLYPNTMRHRDGENILQFPFLEQHFQFLSMPILHPCLFIEQYKSGRIINVSFTPFHYPKMVYQGTTFKGSVSGRVVKSSFTKDGLKPDEVVIKVTHSGLCGTDLHFLKEDMVLGHEGIGEVVEVGPACTKVKVGDRVGWGYPHSSCAQCDQCLSGNDQWCRYAKIFGEADLDQGSFSNLAIWKEQWLFVIPSGLKSEHAAPLMCGGATVFQPLIEHVKPIDRVGIVGIGGLGHLAIIFAAKMGCDVVVFSSTETKREEAMQLGASEFYATKGVTDYSDLGLKKLLNHLLITTSVSSELGLYRPLLDIQAKIFPLTVADGDLVAPYAPTIFYGFQIIGSKLASRYYHTKMLEFAARNKVYPIIELFAMNEEGANAAVKKLQEGTMRYRGVLTWDLSGNQSGL